MTNDSRKLVTPAYQYLFGQSFLHNGERLVHRPQGQLTLWLSMQGLGADGLANSLVQRLKNQGLLFPLRENPQKRALMKERYGLKGKGLFWRIAVRNEVIIEPKPPRLPDRKDTEGVYLGLENAKLALELHNDESLSRKMVIENIELAIAILSREKQLLPLLSEESKESLKRVAEKLRETFGNHRSRRNEETKAVAAMAFVLLADLLEIEAGRDEAEKAWRHYYNRLDPTRIGSLKRNLFTTSEI